MLADKFLVSRLHLFLHVAGRVYQRGAAQSEAGAAANAASPEHREPPSKSSAEVFDATVAGCKKLLNQTRSVLLKKPNSSSEAPSSRRRSKAHTGRASGHWPVLGDD